jgi:hypothetical protein
VPLYFRRRLKLGRTLWLNLSKSGVSLSKRVGPLTFNSRRRANVRIAKGFGWRGGCAVVALVPTAAVAVGIIASVRGLT